MDVQTPTDVAEQPQLVLAIFAGRDRAETAVRALQERGFSSERISVLFRHDDATVSVQEMAAIDREAEATATDVALGSVVGGMAGLLGGLALFSIPGLGPFVGVGVLATTFGGAALGSAVGERAAYLNTLGLSNERTDRYGAALESGEVVVAITALNAAEVMQARELLALQEADEIDVHSPRQLEE